MVKAEFLLNLLTLIVLFKNLVSGEIDADDGLEIPPQNPYPRRHKQPGRSWESWTSPEGTLWYPGRVDYRIRQRQTGNGAGATPGASSSHDTSTRRYFSFEEGPQYLSEHRLTNSAHSQHKADGGVEVNGQGWYPYHGQYGPAMERHLSGESNGQYPVNRGDQYGSYSNGKYIGNVPYGQYFLNGERVPDSIDPLLPKPNVDYVPDPMREHHVPGQRVEYVPGEFIPRPDPHYVPGNGDPRGIDPNRHYIHPDYEAVPDPSGGQDTQFQPGREPESFYVDGRDDYYPDSQYPYYYGEGEDYEQIGVDGGEHGGYIPPGQPYDPNMFYEPGQQPGGEIEGHYTAEQYDKQNPDQPTDHSIDQPDIDSKNAGRDFLPVPTVQNNGTSGQRGTIDSLTNPGAEEHREFPNLVHTGSGRHVRNHSLSESRGIRRGHYVHSERDHGFDRGMSERKAIPLVVTTTTTLPPTTSTTSRPVLSTTTPASTTRSTTATFAPYVHNPRSGRPTPYLNREHQRRKSTNSYTDPRTGVRQGFDEALYPRRSPQRPTIPTVEIDLSKLMPEEEIHGPENSASRIDRFRRPLRPRGEQRPTQSPISAEKDDRRHPHPGRSEAHGTDTPSRRIYHSGGHRPYPRRNHQSGGQHSSRTGSTVSSVDNYGRQSPRHGVIHQRQPQFPHDDHERSGRQHNRGEDQSPPYSSETSRYGYGARTDQLPGRGHQTNPDGRGYGSYQPTDKHRSYNYAAGRDRTHAQGQPEVDSTHHRVHIERRPTFNPSVDSTDENDFGSRGLPGVSHRGNCPSVSKCRCCRWSTQQTRKTMECIQPKFKTVEVDVCTHEINGVCVRTGRKKTQKPDGTEMRMCSKVQLKRSCFVCCPTHYPRGHNQTCNGVLDGIDKRGLRVSVEADIGGFYQPPRISKTSARSQDSHHETAQDESVQQGRQMTGQDAYHALASMMADDKKGMLADQAANSQRICLVQKMGPNGRTITERRPCSSQDEQQSVTEKENATAACCLTREQLHNLFLRYCCNSKRYNGPVYSQRLCCGTKKTSSRQDRETVQSFDRTLDVRPPQLRSRTVVESALTGVRTDSFFGADSGSRVPTERGVPQLKEDLQGGDFEMQWRPLGSESRQARGQFRNANAERPLETESDDTISNPAYPRNRLRSPIDSDTHAQKEEQPSIEHTAEESTDVTGTGISLDSVGRRKCCSSRTRFRSRSDGDQSPDVNSQKSSRKTNGRWMRIYSCCANGNYLQKVACCLKKSPVSPLCCQKVSHLRS